MPRFFPQLIPDPRATDRFSYHISLILNTSRNLNESCEMGRNWIGGPSPKQRAWIPSGHKTSKHKDFS